MLTKLPATAENNQVYSFDVPVGAKGSNLSLKFTNTAGQVKDLHVMQPGTTVGTAWKPAYVDHLKSLHPQALRMMDIIKANSNNELNFSDHPSLAFETCFDYRNHLRRPDRELVVRSTKRWGK